MTQPTDTAPDGSTEVASNGGTDTLCVVLYVGTAQAVVRVLSELPIGRGFCHIVRIADADALTGTDLPGRPVVAVDTAVRLEPDRVYVLPRREPFEVSDGSLQPSNTSGEAAAALDQLVLTLAREHNERVIVVLLDRSEHIGTAALKELQQYAGVLIVEDTGETPGAQAREESVVADRLATIDRIASAVLSYAAPVLELAGGGVRAGLDLVLETLHARSGADFRNYKRSTIGRRVQRRMELAGTPSFADYAELLRTSPDEIDELFRDLLINVTRFFRDLAAWEMLTEVAIRPLVATRQNGDSIRVWCAGCATGEEAYTLAMLFSDELARRGCECVVQIFASDVSPHALKIAREGVYPVKSGEEIPSSLREKYVEADAGAGRLRITKEIRDCVIFAQQNVLEDPPFSRLDLITCRNLLIYLENDVQQRLISMFHFALVDGGRLFLGSAETIRRNSDQFVPISRKWRIYRRVESGRRIGPRLTVPTSPPYRVPAEPDPQRAPGNTQRLSRLAQQLILDRFAPASVLVDSRLEIVYYSGPTHEYLTQPPGAPTHDLLSLVREGLRTKLRAAADRASRSGKAVRITGVRVRRGDALLSVRITMTHVRAEAPLGNLLLVVFEDEPTPEETRPPAADEVSAAPDEDTLRQLEYELQITREDLQSNIEELETSNEGLKAANEEVMSVNEELQSANEELETSKEELQSLNEELSTVNHQLQDKLEELERANNDLGNLLTSTDIATIFLDRQLRIQLYTPAVVRLLNLIPADVGRPLADLSRKFTDVNLLADAQTVLETLTPIRTEIRTDQGHWYLRSVLPYRTDDDRIEGVVITFVDISERKAAGIALAVSEDRYRLLVDTIRDYAILMIDAAGMIATWSSGAAHLFGYSAEEALGSAFESVFMTEPREPGIARACLEAARRIGRHEAEHWLLRPDGSCFLGHTIVVAVVDADGGVHGYSVVVADLTDRNRMEEELRKLNESLEQKVAERTARLRAMSSDMLMSEERERRALAADLHDDLGQTLALAKMRLRTLIADGDVDSASVGDLEHLLDDANRSVRSITLQMSPPILYELGLGAGLQWLGDEMSRRFALAVAVRLSEIPTPIDERVALVLFRSARELLINVAKHAGVDRAELTLSGGQQELVLTVADKGTGFDTADHGDARRADSFGLFSVRERLEQIGGTMVLESTPGAGTVVTLRSPYSF